MAIACIGSTSARAAEKLGLQVSTLMRSGAAPCRAVPCCAMTCCAVPCRAVLCRDMLCCAVPCCAVLHHASRGRGGRDGAALCPPAACACPSDLAAPPVCLAPCPCSACGFLPNQASPRGRQLWRSAWLRLASPHEAALAEAAARPNRLLQPRCLSSRAADRLACQAALACQTALGCIGGNVLRGKQKPSERALESYIPPCMPAPMTPTFFLPPAPCPSFPCFQLSAAALPGPSAAALKLHAARECMYMESPPWLRTAGSSQRSDAVMRRALCLTVGEGWHKEL